MQVQHWADRWQAAIEAWVIDQLQSADAGHGMDHIRRVVRNALQLGEKEHARVDIILPAAWLHDCVVVSKDSPHRSKASTFAAQAAKQFLEQIEYPAELIPCIEHCIQAHSFSANIACESLEAQIVQDADRLEALGAIGIARCLMTGGALRQQLYLAQDPFPVDRKPADTLQSIDHFFAKLLSLHRTMKTASGKAEALQRTEFLVVFLKQLAKEIGASDRTLSQAIVKWSSLESSKSL